MYAGLPFAGAPLLYLIAGGVFMVSGAIAPRNRLLQEKEVMIRIKFLGWLLLLIIATQAASPYFLLAQTATQSQKPAKKGRALIVYSGEEYGNTHFSAEKIKFYLKHFEVEADMISSSKYSENLSGSYRWVFYFGAEDERLNSHLLKDLSSEKKKDSLDKQEHRSAR